MSLSLLKSYILALAFCASSLLSCVALAQSVKDLHASEANGDYEPALITVIDSIQNGQLVQALSQADEHLKRFPKSSVGHFLRADVLTAMSQPISAIGSGFLPSNSSGLLPSNSSGLSSSNSSGLSPSNSSGLSPSNSSGLLAGLKHQIRNRWAHANKHADAAHTLFPSSLIELGENQYVIVADMPEGRLYLYENGTDGEPKLIRDYYMSVGSAGYGKQFEGDNKTPIGVYVINQHIEGKALPDLYGKGAFPVDYPNRFDRYRKRTGYGIWLHGTPSSTYARSPWASEGCFVLSNDDLLDIGQYISAEDRTPVILSDTIEWLSAEELSTRRQQFYAVIKQWKSDWESLDTQAYLQHYSQDTFNLGKAKYKPWAQRKAQVNQAKTFVQVDLQLKSVFSYPGEDDMFVVKYRQNYLSNNYSGETNKEQYWKKSATGKWQIIYEG